MTRSFAPPLQILCAPQGTPPQFKNTWVKTIVSLTRYTALPETRYTLRGIMQQV